MPVPESIVAPIYRVEWPTLVIWLCVLIRIMPIVLLVPVFGGSWAPRWISLLAGGALALSVAPAVTGAGAATPIASTLVVGLGVNLVVGLTIGFTASLVFHAASAAGSLIDASSQPTDLPIAPHDFATGLSGPVERFLTLFAVTLFFVIGGHEVFIAVVADSFRVLPPLTAPAPTLVGTPVRESIITLSASVFVLAVQLAAPAIVVTLMVDLLAGMLHRLALPVNAFFLALTLKAGLAVGATFVALGLIATALRGQFAEMIVTVGEMVSTFISGV